MHTVYRNAHRETTQWDDAQRKLGNLPPLPPEEKPEKYAPEREPTTADRVAEANTAEELEDLEVSGKSRPFDKTSAEPPALVSCAAYWHVRAHGEPSFVSGRRE